MMEKDQKDSLCKRIAAFLLALLLTAGAVLEISDQLQLRFI